MKPKHYISYETYRTLDRVVFSDCGMKVWTYGRIIAALISAWINGTFQEPQLRPSGPEAL